MLGHVILQVLPQVLCQPIFRIDLRVEYLPHRWLEIRKIGEIKINSITEADYVNPLPMLGYNISRVHDFPVDVVAQFVY